MDSLHIEYTYHQHTGDATLGTGCYTTPIPHIHVSSCYRQCTGTARYQGSANNGWGAVFTCDMCHQTFTNGLPEPNSTWAYYPDGTTGCACRIVVCGKSNDGYTVGCGKDETTIESATLFF